MSKFKRSLGYGMLDQVVARIFDFATLWVVMRTLPETDLASYGIATAVLFIFNLVLVVPEAALMRDKKIWEEQGSLGAHMRGFVLFAELRIALVASACLVVANLAGWRSPYFVACVLALVNQFIQLAEITRLDFRIDLQQRQVFRIELVLKVALLALVTLLFSHPGLHMYLGLFLAWALVAAVYWFWQLHRKYSVRPHLDWPTLRLPWAALKNFSLWQHLSGVITYVIYNIDPWVLSWFGTEVATISVYTLALKVSALFFTIPMFVQSMTTIFLVNSEDAAHKQRRFRKMFGANAALSVAQFVVFALAGKWLGTLFRGDQLDLEHFYRLGMVLCFGVLVLNVVRPLIADLILHAPMRRLLLVVYVPALLVALGSYPLLTYRYGSLGCAGASMLSYCIFAALLIWQSRHHGVARAALGRTSIASRLLPSR